VSKGETNTDELRLKHEARQKALYPRDPRRDVPEKPAHPDHSRPKKNRLTVKIGGEAGFGIATTGMMLTRAMIRGGLFALDYTEYPSLIRGGHNTFLVRVDEEPVTALISSLNVLIALNLATVLLHQDELTDDGAIIYDTDEVKLDPAADLKRQSFALYGIPLERLAVEAGGDKLMRNTVALGAFVAITGYSLPLLAAVIRDVFAGKGKEKAVLANITAATAGYQYVLDNFPQQFTYVLKEKRGAKTRIALMGSDAVALGAIQAGCTFYAAYPMTPSSGVLHYLAAQQAKAGLIVRHAEDEIAAINLAIGASFMGARAMTGTAGGGFALMVEALGLAAITETPLVILEAQRPGPATGLPTWTDQADLRFVMHAAQGEFPRVILAPGDVDEAFYLTHEAFNLADRFQLPVFVMTDKYLMESHFSAVPFDTSSLNIDRGKMVSTSELKKLKRRYKRYELTEGGISPRSIPGQENGVFLANSDEHDEFGYSSEDAAMRVRQTKKRMGKADQLLNEVPAAKLHGPTGAELTIFGWGSTKGAILEALQHLQHDGITANFLQLVTLWPFPTKAVEAVLGKATRTLLVENNYTGQLGGLIREHTGTKIEEKLLKYDGRPIYPEEVYHRVKEMLI